VGGCAARASRRHAALHLWVLASTLIVIALRLSDNRPRAGRNSGRDASAGRADAPVAVAIERARSRSQHR
jgi:hypothetical protein